MSHKNQKVYLGYDDDCISDKHLLDVSFITNKIGGQPNWPPLKDLRFDTCCELCGILRPMVLQCYAPLQDSPYHRTLYIFACVNPRCWNNSKSWSCVRSQYIDESYVENLKKNKAQHSLPSTNVNAKDVPDSWCVGADDWGDDGDSKMLTNISDDEDDEVSFTIDRSLKSNNELEDIEMAVGHLHLSKEIFRQDRHAHTIVAASAEIDGDISEITVETPTVPENNISELYLQVPELPDELVNSKNIDTVKIQFVPKFMSVAEEYLSNDDGEMAHHVTHLMQQYAKANESVKPSKETKLSGGNFDADEEYEEAVPLHGDQIFHSFLTRIQINPTQIIRYSLGGQPLLMSALPKNSMPIKCLYCNGDTSFELQILPTIIPSLRFPNSNCTYLEFGTVLIYTCSKSCWKNDDVLLTETVVVQSEPM